MLVNVISEGGEVVEMELSLIDRPTGVDWAADLLCLPSRQMSMEEYDSYKEFLAEHQEAEDKIEEVKRSLSEQEREEFENELKGICAEKNDWPAYAMEVASKYAASVSE